MSGDSGEEAAAVVRAYFAAAHRDEAALLATLDQDVLMRVPASLPYGGTYRGHDGLRRALAGFAATWMEAEISGLQLVWDGSTVMALSTLRARAAASGRTVETDVAELFRVEGGKVVEVRPFYADTAALLAVLGTSAGNPPRRDLQQPDFQHDPEEPPMTDQPVPPPGAVVLINPFRVPAGEREVFLANYRATMERLSLQDGFLGGGLHELLEPVNREAFDFVNVNHWQSVEAFRAGLAAANPDGIFGDQVARLEAHPGLFRVATAYGAWARPAVPPVGDAADRLAIMEVACRFETTFDRGELDAHMELWTEALSFESPYMGNFHDRASYRAGLERFYEKLAAKGGTRHLMTNFEIDLAGDRAQVRSYLSVHNRKSGASLGIVEWRDEMVRTAAGWRYVRRLQVP